MGLTALAQGGFPAFDNTIAGVATIHKHPYFTRALDSSGGEYVYAKASTSAIVGSFVAVLADGQATVLASTVTSTQGTLFGVQTATANATTQDVWVQVHGPAVALGDSTTGAGGTELFTSTSANGALSVATTGARLFGAHITSSNASSLWNVYLNHVTASIA